MLKHVRQSGTLIGLLGIALFFAVQLPDTFLTARNLLNVSQQISMLAVTAFTMTIVMVMGDFDLSVGSTASLAGIMAAVLFAAGWPVWVGVTAALAIGVVGGILNGALVAYLGILPFIATLGTLTVFSGTAFLVSDGKTIFGRDIPQSFADFAKSGLPLGSLGDKPVILPWLTVLALAIMGVVFVVLELSTYGRRLYAIGGNAEAARLAGVRVTWLRLTAYGFTGVGAAVAGLMYASRVASANPTQGEGLMLNAIAAVFLGMTVTRHGQPRVVASVLGVLVLGIMDNGLTQLQVDSYVREVLVGLIILLAVSISALGRRATGRR